MHQKIKRRVVGLLSMTPLACAVFVLMWPGWRRRRWQQSFERQHGYDPTDPSLDWRETPMTESLGLSAEIAIVVGCLAVIGLVVALALLVYFSWLVSTSEVVDSGEKRTWVVALVVGNLIVFPLVWYTFVWKEQPD